LKGDGDDSTMHYGSLVKWLMARQNTQLECTGAEFLVLGNLLIQGIPAYKNYVNMPGFDLVAMNPEGKLSARIQVKSRWRTKAEGFPISRFDCDFVVIVLLNRGSKDGKAEVRQPDFFVLPVEFVRELPRSESWGKIMFSKVPQLSSYRDSWDQIRLFLKLPSITRGV
jgi:hypothetical protein